MSQFKADIEEFAVGTALLTMCFLGLLAIGFDGVAESQEVDRVFAACPMVASTCFIEKTQQGKFGAISRTDFESHVCGDGSSASRETNKRVVLSTYEPAFSDFSGRIKKLATEQGCRMR
jgi:hypothetical protein